MLAVKNQAIANIYYENITILIRLNQFTADRQCSNISIKWYTHLILKLNCPAFSLTFACFHRYLPRPLHWLPAHTSHSQPANMFYHFPYFPCTVGTLYNRKVVLGLLCMANSLLNSQHEFSNFWNKTLQPELLARHFNFVNMRTNPKQIRLIRGRHQNADANFTHPSENV